MAPHDLTLVAVLRKSRLCDLRFLPASTVTPSLHTVGMASKREGLSLAGFFQRFPDDAAAEVWFTERRWPDGPECPHCASTNIATVASRKPMPYRCRGCRKHFSVTVGTIVPCQHFCSRFRGFGLRVGSVR